MEMIKRLKAAQKEQQPKELNYPDPLEELQRLKDIDVNPLRDHIDRKDRNKSQQQLKLIRELGVVKNHQAYWIHNERRKADQERMKVNPDDTPRPESMQQAEEFFANPNSKMTHVKSYIMV
jgi:hypothetical protein